MMIAPGPLYAKKPPQRSRTHLAFVRSHPCSVCGSWRNVEAAHVGPRGLGQIADDFDTIPLCKAHHRIGKYSFHGLGRVAFETRYKLDIGCLILQLQELGRTA